MSNETALSIALAGALVIIIGLVRLAYKQRRELSEANVARGYLGRVFFYTSQIAKSTGFTVTSKQVVNGKHAVNIGDAPNGVIEAIMYLNTLDRGEQIALRHNGEQSQDGRQF